MNSEDTKNADIQSLPSPGEYTPTTLDKKWQRFWDENKTFATDSKAAAVPGAKKFYCLDMFPYPSGSGLHVGHPLGYTATDIYCRYLRMNNYVVLHPMGFDSFGLPAEQHAIATGEHPALVTKKNCEVFTKQLKTVGLSYDWDRSLATSDVEYYRWTQWIFLKIFNSWFDPVLQKARPIGELPIPKEIQEAGEKAITDYQAQFRLAYYAEAQVNWCPALGTVLANEEVIDGKSERGGFDVIRKPMRQWMLRITAYTERLISELEGIDWPESIKEQQRNWIGKKTGARITFKIEGSNDSFDAFTTRPDTLFGVTFFVISPEHKAVASVTTDAEKKNVEEYCEQAKKLSDLARTVENRQKTGAFTGTYVINPINGAKVPLFVGDYVLMNVGTGAVMGVPAHDERDFDFAKLFNLPIIPVLAPAKGDAEIKDRVLRGELCWTESGEMIANRDAVFAELGLEGKTNKEAQQKIIAWLESKNLGGPKISYKLRDWLFSRQRYWGEPIPVIHWEDGIMTALSESDLPLVLPEVADYKPSDGGESPLAKATDWLHVVDPKTGKKGRRETNTMPQWAGSCWYYLRFIDPKNKNAAWDRDLEKSWMPVDFYIGGAEHAVLHLLYARFWHKVLFDLGEVSTKEPFQRLFNQGMVQAFAFKDGRGALVPTPDVEDKGGKYFKKETGEQLEQIVAKMSKSLRNVINLDTIVDEYGADTFRLYLMFMGPLDTSRPWDPKAVNGVHRFLRRAWNFVTSSKETGIRDVIEQESATVTRARHRLIKRVSADVNALQFNTAIAGMMEFLNEVEKEQVSRETVQTFTLLIAPFAPHLGEELFERLGGTGSVSKQVWPTFDESVLVESKAVVVVQVNGKKRAMLEVPIDISEDDIKQLAIKELDGGSYPVKPQDQFIVVRNPQTKAPKLLSIVAK